MDKCWIFGIKKYAYLYKAWLNSVLSGIERNSLTLDDINKLMDRDILTIRSKPQFFKSLEKLNITIKSKELSIKFDTAKTLVGNRYKNIYVNKIEDRTCFIIKKILNMIKRNFNKISKNPQTTNPQQR